MVSGFFDIIRRALGWKSSSAAIVEGPQLTLPERSLALTLKSRTIGLTLPSRSLALTLKERE